jgi:hypothetical protein
MTRNHRPDGMIAAEETACCTGASLSKIFLRSGIQPPFGEVNWPKLTQKDRNRHCQSDKIRRLEEI